MPNIEPQLLVQDVETARQQLLASIEETSDVAVHPAVALQQADPEQLSPEDQQYVHVAPDETSVAHKVLHERTDTDALERVTPRRRDAARFLLRAMRNSTSVAHEKQLETQRQRWRVARGWWSGRIATHEVEPHAAVWSKES